MGSVCREGSLLTALPCCCHRDVEGNKWASGPQLAALMDGVLQAFAQAFLQRLAALASRSALERQLPISADAGWIWRLFFHRLCMTVVFLYFPLPAAHVLTGKKSLLWHGTKETAAMGNAGFLLV